MPSYKLTYFDSRGRGELCRMLFALKGVEYEDERVTQEAWKERKSSTMFGQLPQLTIDGVVIPQSNTMARYLARQFGLAGKTPIEQSQADAIVDFLEDMVRPLEYILVYAVVQDDQKKEMGKKYGNEKLPIFLEKLEKLLISNKGGDGYLIGDSMTWADICYINMVTWPAYGNIEVNWEPIPKLKALKEKVESEPKIAEWIKKRPKTAM